MYSVKFGDQHFLTDIENLEEYRQWAKDWKKDIEIHQVDFSLSNPPSIDDLPRMSLGEIAELLGVTRETYVFDFAYPCNFGHALRAFCTANDIDQKGIHCFVWSYGKVGERDNCGGPLPLTLESKLAIDAYLKGESHV